MDIATDLPETEQIQLTDALSYDDTVAYEQQLPSVTEIEAGLDPRSNENPLANRIGNTKIYLLSEASAAARKRNHAHEDSEIIFDRSKRIPEPATEEDGMEETEEADVGYRTNAILLRGTPISQLPTARLFAYAKHFDTTPLGLEWVNDETCVLVYPSSTLARAAFASLQKPPSGLTSESTFDGFEVAKPIPLSLWPPTTRINKTLGTSSGLSGVIHMRWATPSDVKKKGAKRESEFYKRHGDEAGKEIFDGRDLPPASQRPRTTGAHSINGNAALGGGEEDRAFERQRLDAELDQFLRESESDKDLPMEDEITEGGDIIPPSPPSRMRSDYIADDGRTLLDRFSDPSLLESEKNPAERAGGLGSRLSVVPRPRRSRESQGRKRGDGEDDSASGSSLWERLSSADVDSDTGMGRERRRGGSGRSSRHHPYERDDTIENTKKGGRRGETRPKKTQQELDDELDAFLKQG